MPDATWVLHGKYSYVCIVIETSSVTGALVVVTAPSANALFQHLPASSLAVNVFGDIGSPLMNYQL